MKIFLKDESQDPQLIKSYRPVTLLPVIRKIAERMIALHFREFLDKCQFFGPHQFGFTRGRGTVDGLCELRRRVVESEERYVVGVFLDISGGFDFVQPKNGWLSGGIV